MSHSKSYTSALVSHRMLNPLEPRVWRSRKGDRWCNRRMTNHWCWHTSENPLEKRQLVMSTTLEEHLENLRTVLTRGSTPVWTPLQAFQMWSVQQEVEYLGDCVSAAGVMTDPSKVDAVHVFPSWQMMKSLQSFLGLASCYWRFIPNFPVIVCPLFKLTKKEVVCQWDQSCQQAFNESNCLSLPRFLFKIHTGDRRLWDRPWSSSGTRAPRWYYTSHCLC